MSLRALPTLCALAALVASARAQTTLRLTGGLGGAEPNGASGEPSTSGDGRFVVFTSAANNLTPSDTSPGADVFLHDASTGVLELITVREFPFAQPNTVSGPVVSDDGRFVAYSSDAVNLVVGDSPVPDVYVRDRAAGITTRITAGWKADSLEPALTPDGRYVAFTSHDDIVVPSGIYSDVFRFDRQTGLFELVSRSTAGLNGNRPSRAPRISADGALVAFESGAFYFAPDDFNGVDDLYVRDLSAGTTQRVSLGALGNELGAASRIGSLARDGRFLCFDNPGGDVTSGDLDQMDDVFVRDVTFGGVARASTPAGSNAGDGASSGGRMSGDGRWVAFRSTATDLVAPDPTPGVADVYLKDLQTSAIEIVSRASDGVPAPSSDGVALSDDGRRIAFVSSAGLVPGDANGFAEIYVRDRGAVVYTTPCAGDGTGTPCPCGNPGYPGNGCENYAISGGVRLAAIGSASLSNDTLRLDLSGFLSTFETPIAFAQGDALLNGGLGVPFGDGIQCVGGNTVRFGRRIATGGASAYGARVAGDAPLSVACHVTAPGSTRYYQCVYFNFGSFCGQLRRNWSNSIAIVWGA